MKHVMVMSVVLGLVACMSTPAVADFWDDFEDGYYWYDSNVAFDPNIAPSYIGGMYPSPSYDPNDWDPNNPQWDFYTLIGAGWYTAVENFNGSEWLRMVVQPAPISPFGPIGWFAATVNDGETDPNISDSYFNDTESHYLLAKVAYPGIPTDPNLDDPNDDAGVVRLLLHADPVQWSTIWLHYEFYEDNPWSGGWASIVLYMAGLYEIRLPNGSAIRPPEINPNDYDPADPNWSASMRRSYPGYPDEKNGFWMLIQWEAFDANYPTGDPNGKAVWAAFWNGDKFDWDGEYDLGCDFPNYPNHPRARSGDIALWDDGAAYSSYGFNEGLCMINNEINMVDENPAGRNGEAAYDEVEARWGVFGAVKHNLDLTIYNPHKGQIEISPDNPDPADPFDPNTLDPNDPNTNPDARLLRYVEGCEVTLVAVPGEGSFKEWRVYDPNFPGDSNYVTVDTNSVLYVTMDDDYVVEVDFKCGSGVPPFLAMTLLALGLGVVIRRMV